MLLEGISIADQLLERFATRRARVVVIGQGYVGLPLALQIARAGFTVTGLDRDVTRVGRIQAGRSPVADVTDDDLASLMAADLYDATVDPDVIGAADVVIISVPTPLDAARRPDLGYVRAAAATVARYLDAPRLVVLESTSPPGTTRDVVLPILAADTRQAGRDFFLAFAPERIDPGNQTYHIGNTPKLIGGITPDCGQVAVSFYRHFIESMDVVSSPEVAEMAKAVENGFRFVNISFVNEVAMLCDKIGVDVWEVIRAASSKPFAFMPHFPGPGVGGACIPVVPFYLTARADDVGVTANVIRAAGEINDRMPVFVAEKLERLLAERGRTLADGRVLVVGVSYKPNLADMRESPAPPVIEALRARGARVAYHDPLVPTLALADGATLASEPITPDTLADVTATVVVTPHAAIDYHQLARSCPLVFDTRNALAPLGYPNVVAL